MKGALGKLNVLPLTPDLWPATEEPLRQPRPL